MSYHEYSQKEKDMLQKMQKEHALFQYKILLGSVREVYDA